MQATVRTFDRTTRAGDVLLDDGSVMTFPREAFDASGLRMLRLGQRVRLRLDATGAVDLVTLATFPDPPDPT